MYGHFRTYPTAYPHGAWFDYRSVLTNIAARLVELVEQTRRWGQDNAFSVLYFSELLPYTALPWHYAPAMVALMVEIRMSRCFTCASSWAITPRSSRSDSTRRMPVVAATAA